MVALNYKFNLWSEILLYFRVSACCLCAFTTGMSTSWTSPMISQFNSTSNPFNRRLTTTETTLFSSIIMIGAATFGSLTWYLLDRIGRRGTLQLSQLLSLFAYGSMRIFYVLPVYYAARFILGLGYACGFSVLSVFIGEMAEPRNRGALIFILSIFTSLGLLFSYCVGSYLKMVDFIEVSMIPYVVFLLASVTVIPESPYFLVAKGRFKEAAKTLSMLRNQPTEMVHEELCAISRTVEEANSTNIGFLDVFKSKSTRKAFYVCICCVTFQQFSGINAVLAYLHTTFEASGNPSAASLYTIIFGLIQLVTSIFVVGLVDRMGRRPLLIISALGCSLSHTLLAIYFQISSPPNWLPLFSTTLYIIFFKVGLSPITWTLIGELFPPNVKAMATTMAVSWCSLMAAAMMYGFPVVSEAVGMEMCFWFFAVSCACAGVYMIIRVPETKGISFDEIQELLGSGRKNYVKLES